MKRSGIGEIVLNDLEHGAIKSEGASKLMLDCLMKMGNEIYDGKYIAISVDELYKFFGEEADSADV